MRHLLALGVVLLAVSIPAAAQVTQPAPTDQAGSAAPTASPAPAAANAQPRTIPSGTELSIRTNEAIDATSAQVGRTYSAQLAQDLVDQNGTVLAPKGSPAQLAIAAMNSGTAGVGSKKISLALRSITAGNQTYTVQSEPVTESGNRGLGANKRTAEMTGGGAALGTVVGAIAGGGKGAAIGALAGGGAGATAQVLTRGDEVKVPAESVLTFRLDQSITMQ